MCGVIRARISVRESIVAKSNFPIGVIFRPFFACENSAVAVLRPVVPLRLTRGTNPNLN